MRRIFMLAVAMVVCLGSVCHAAQPKASSLKEAWQDLNEKCGILSEKDGIYTFLRDERLPGDGRTCVVSVGTDMIVLGPNPKGAILDSAKQYLLVPMERIVLAIHQ